MEFTKEQINLLLNFLNALNEQQNELELKENLKEEINKFNNKKEEIEKRVLARNTIIVSTLKGIILEKTNQNSVFQFELLENGGNEKLKYKGITIKKHNTCNTWYARYRKNGKQFYVSEKTQKDCYNKLKHELNKKTKTEIKEKRENKNKQIKTLTFNEWYEKWKKLYKSDVREGTLKEYRTDIGHLKPLQNKPLNEITSIEIQEQLNLIDGKRAKQRVYEFLKMVFDKAFANEIIAKNPMNIIDKPKYTRTNGNALSSEDEPILEQMLINDNADAFLICLYQGLRRGEVLALKADDIDLEKNILTIDESFNYKNNLSETKNKSSKRNMPIFEKTKPILEKYIKVKGRIFEMAYRTMEKQFNKYAERFKIKYTMHSLRHTFITRCQEMGIPLHIIQKWVGHVNGSFVTNNVYTHARSSAEAENILIYNKKLNSN